MSPIKRIVLATDLEPNSDRAMERAALLARQFDAELTVLYAIRVGEQRGILDSLPPHHIEAEMRRHLECIPGGKDLTAMVVAAKGPVEQAMARYAALWKADLMVVGRPEPADGLLSVTTVERISVASPLPLLSVAAKPFGPYATALVPVDFSPLSRLAIEAALDMVAIGAIEVLHVHDAPAARMSLETAVAAEDFAGDFAPLLKGTQGGGRLVTVAVRLGTPVEGIIRAAQALPPAQLIVMTTTGRSGLGRALIGSVAHEVLERMPCDVLLVRETAAPQARIPG